MPPRPRRRWSSSSGTCPASTCSRIQGRIQDVIERIDARTVRWPRLVLGALDSVEARYDLQRLHPDLLLDGSTGGQAGTILALHEAVPTGPCQRCYFKVDHSGPSAEQRLHELTGIPMQRIAPGDEPLTEQDLSHIADPGLRARLLGKPVCGLANMLGLTGDGPDGFRPSAAFVAQQAGCLVVGAWIARASELVAARMRHVEYDARFGPRSDEMTDHRLPSSSCACQTDAALIARVRADRARCPGRRWQSGLAPAATAASYRRGERC